MSKITLLEGISLIGDKTLTWGTRIEVLLNEFKPTKDIKGDCLTLIWGDVNFFGAILSAKSSFFPEEILVKDRHIHELILIGEIETRIHQNVISGVNGEIGDPTGHLELPNLSSHNWIHDDIQVSSSFMPATKILKVVIKK